MNIKEGHLREDLVGKLESHVDIKTNKVIVQALLMWSRYLKAYKATEMECRDEPLSPG